MFSNAFAVLNEADDRDADGFQTVGEGRRKRNQLPKQDATRDGSPGSTGARNRNAAPNARHRAGHPQPGAPPRSAAGHAAFNAPEPNTRADLAPVKVQLCKMHMEKGRCSRGNTCPFAHGEVELGKLNPRAALLLTHWNDQPPPGPGPHVRALAVNPHPTADDAKKYKRRICTFWEEGTCDQGSICSFAHGEGEMRRKGDPVPSIEYLRSLYTGAKAPDDEWFPGRPQPNAHASLNDGEFPTLGNGRPRAFNPPGVRLPPRGGNGSGMQNGAPHRGPSVAPPSNGGASANGGAPAGVADQAAHASAALPLTQPSDQEADEAAQLAAALAASQLDQWPDRQPPAGLAPAAPSGNESGTTGGVAAPAPPPPRRPPAYNPLNAARRAPAAAPAARPPPPPSSQPPAQAAQRPVQRQGAPQPPAPRPAAVQQPPPPPPPPLVFGSLDDALSDDEDDDDYPNAFQCPIMHDLMIDPVVAADGVTYERKAIEDWFGRSGDSPLMGMRLDHKEVIPNVALREAIRRAYPRRFPAMP